jgi:asparagine synthase (glutamine-hydrolysing)
MCGITGFVNSNKSAVDQSTLEKMNAAIIHRGPDQDGFFIKENVGLAMRRLSIIDLASGKQPIFSQDKTKSIVFNGEIYNYQELRKNLEEKGVVFYTNSDTEAIVNLYQLYGADCLQHLRGMFAFAIWDETEQSLFIARDRIGKKPLLYSHQTNGDLIFGSEFKALLQHPKISREVDYEAIDAYLNLSCVPAPLTAFKAIRKLEPGHWMLWKNGEIKIERYWLPDFSKKIKISEEDAIEETTRILREAVKLRMISEVPLGAFLSGGVDSSAVVALMAEESSTPVKTFSIGFEEQDYSELKYAKIVANHIGAEYNEFVVKPNALEILPMLVEHYGEPYADSSAIPTYYVSKETRNFVTVALNGDGGDESFGGYERYAAMRLAENYQKIPSLLRKIFVNAPINAFPVDELKRSRVRDLKRFIKSAEKSETERYFSWMSAIQPEMKQCFYTNEFRARLNGSDATSHLQRYFDKAANLGVIDKLLFVDQQTYLPNDLLPKVDIASMAVSLEARSPFLDHKLIEFAASLPENFKMNRLTPKYLLKKVAARLVPSEVIYRKKMGFGVPLGSWFRGEMKGFLQEVLLSEKSLNRGIIKPEFLQNLIDEHISAKRDNSYQLWTILMLELWFQRFID